MPKALSEHDVLIMLVALTVFVGFARLVADLVGRLRQPQVLGELLAGVLLGPSLLGVLWPAAAKTVGRGAHILEPVSWMGIILLLALTGMETDFRSLRREAGAALLTTIGGVALPLVAGFALGMALPQSFVGSGGSRLAFALFIALAMSISAVTVIAKVLTDLHQMRRTAAKIILTGGVFDETLGWILLALVSGLVGTHPGVGDTLAVLGKAAAFLTGAALFGRRLVASIVRVVRERTRLDHAAFTVTVVLAFAFAAITEALGLHQILGSFVFGVIAGTVPRIDRETVERVRTVTRGLLVPVFFLFAGLKVDLTQLRHREVLLAAGAFIGIAIACKVIGCTLGGLMARMPWRDALLVGIGMSARGSMEIVLAVLGLSLGILSPAIFSVIVLLSVVTILLVPPLLRVAFAWVKPSEEEQRRIEREELDAKAYTPNLRRVLVPLLPSGSSEVGAEIARALALSKANAAEPLEIVVLRVGGPEGSAGQRPAEERLVRETNEAKTAEPVEVEEQVARRIRPADVIDDAVQRGYQMMILGVTSPKRQNSLFGPLVDRILSEARVDTFVVSTSVGFEVDHVKRIAVPFTGRESSRAAGDFALALASGLGATVYAINVARQIELDGKVELEQLERHRTTMEQAMNELRERADLLGVAFESSIRTAASPSAEILRELRRPHYDLCVLGATNQSHSGTPFYGDTADLLLRYAPTPVGLLVLKI